MEMNKVQKFNIIYIYIIITEGSDNNMISLTQCHKEIWQHKSLISNIFLVLK